jgi:hypothetical protein
MLASYLIRRRKLESGSTILKHSQNTIGSLGKPKRIYGGGSVRRLKISPRERDCTEYWLRTLLTQQGHLKKLSGEHKMTGKETLEVLLQTHFPESNIINPQDECNPQNPINLNQRATMGDWQTSNRIINYNRVSWAISSFDAYKSPGPDGIFPALLQQGKEDFVPVLGRLYRANLST